MNTNTDMSTLTGAYAVNALPEDERREFEDHLAGCPDCTEEVRELRETAARLGAALAATPPEELKQRVLDEVLRTRQLPPVTDGDHRRDRGPRRRRLGTRLAAVAAAAGIVLAAAFGAVALRSQDEMHEAQRQMAAAEQRHAEMSAIMAAPDAKMQSTGGQALNGTAVMSKDMGKTVFLGSAQRVPPPSHVYQLWFIGNYGYRSAGVLAADGGGQMQPVVAPLPAGTAGMGVTVEPTGGSPQPTTDPVLKMTTPV